MPFYLVSAVRYEDPSKTKIKSVVIHCTAPSEHAHHCDELPAHHIANLPKGIIVSREQLLQAASRYRVMTVAVNLLNFSFEHKQPLLIVQDNISGAYIKTEKSMTKHDNLGTDIAEF